VVPWEAQAYVATLADIVEEPSESLLVEASSAVTVACIEGCYRLVVVLQILGSMVEVGQDCKLASGLGSFGFYPHQRGLRDLFCQDSCLEPFSCHMMVRIEYFSLLPAVSSYRRHVHHLVS